MSHQISFSKGVAEAAFALTPAWHGLGRVIPHGMTSEEALREAHLDWTVETRPLFRADRSQVASHVETFRTDTMRELGVVGSAYKIVQNREVADMLDQLNKDGIVKYESAFALRGGRRVVFLARLAETFNVTDADAVQSYCMLSTSHDGTGALYVMPTNVRVVCANTFGMAVAEGQRKGEKLMFKLRHTSNVGERIDSAVATIATVSQLFAEQGRQAVELRQLKLDETAFDKFLDKIMPLPEPVKANGNVNPAFEKGVKARQTVHALWTHGPLNCLPGIAGTAWGAFNAVTEYVDHKAELGRESENYSAAESAFNVKIDGAGAQVKLAAWNELRQLVTA